MAAKCKILNMNISLTNFVFELIIQENFYSQKQLLIGSHLWTLYLPSDQAT